MLQRKYYGFFKGNCPSQMHFVHEKYVSFSIISEIALELTKTKYCLKEKKADRLIAQLTTYNIP